jgi:hypothetical protein
MKISDLMLERPGQQTTTTLYHGTTSKYWPSIKKHGLLPNIEGNGFGSDDEAMRSYGGNYLSANKGTAEEAANEVAKIHGGNPIIISVQYVLGSGGADEDSIIYDVIDLASEEGVGPKGFAKGMLEALPGKLPQGDWPLLVQLFKRIKTMMKKAGAEDAYEIEDEIKTDANFRAILTAIINKIRMNKLDNYSNVRIDRTIGFRGKTRIIGVEEVKPY